MRSWIAASVILMLGLLSSAANAAVVRGVSVTKGKGWVRVTVNAPGAGFRVHELPVGSAAGYRSIAIDVPNSYIAGGLEPKSRVPVNEGLVAQVRVKQLGGTVRVLVDVIAFPKYTWGHGPGGFSLGLHPYHMREGDPLRADR